MGTSEAVSRDGRDGRDGRSGPALGLAAYAMWGVFPLYWPLLEPASPWEILCHRIVWSFASLALFTTVARRWDMVAAVVHNRRQLGLLFAAAAMVSVNWGFYIWAVNAHHVVETALGYFINPLVSVVLGVAALRERLNRGQWAAVAVAAGAVIGLTFDYGRLPWIALVLAFSFGMYGLMKKLAAADAFSSLTIETAAATAPAVVGLGWLGAHGHLSMAHEGAGHTALLVLAGPVTTIPLLCFGAAARRVRLSMLGVMQYLAPTIQLIIGVTVAHERMPASRWLGFAAVWLALIVFTAATVGSRRRTQPVRSTT